MTKKAQHIIPEGEPWIFLTRALIESDAWRSASINARRVVDFLIMEHLRHGGKENGKLKAPQRQLIEYGVSSRLVVEAIREAEILGLITKSDTIMRVATTYALSWLPRHNGAKAGDEWRKYQNQSLGSLPLTAPSKRKSALTSKGSAALTSEGR